MEIFHEYAFALDGTTIIATVRWYLSDDPAESPIHTDTFRFSLTDAATTPGRVYQEFLDRRALVIRAIETYQALMAAFGGNQNERRAL